MALAAAVEGRAVNLHRQSLRAETRGVKLIDQIDRRDEEAIAAGLNDPARPAVDRIGHGAHPDQIAPPLEDVFAPTRSMVSAGAEVMSCGASRLLAQVALIARRE